MQISTFFQPDLVWRKQLLPLIGPVEVDKMDSKLKEMNMKGLDGLQVFYTSMFPSPPSKLEAEFADLLRDIGSWPQVLYRGNMKRKLGLLILDSRWVCPVFPHLALLSWHAGPGQQEAGGGHTAQVLGSPAKISWQKASMILITMITVSAESLTLSLTALPEMRIPYWHIVTLYRRWDLCSLCRFLLVKVL